MFNANLVSSEKARIPYLDDATENVSRFNEYYYIIWIFINENGDDSIAIVLGSTPDLHAWILIL